MKTKITLLALLSVFLAGPTAFGESRSLLCEGLHEGKLISIEVFDEDGLYRADVSIDGQTGPRFQVGNTVANISEFLQNGQNISGGPATYGRFKLEPQINEASLGVTRASASFAFSYADYEYISADNLEMICE